MEDIKQMLGAILSNQGMTNAKLESVDKRLSHVEGRLTHVEDRLKNVEDRLTNVEGRLTDIEGRLSLVEDHLSVVERNGSEMKVYLHQMDEKPDKVEQDTHFLKSKVMESAVLGVFCWKNMFERCGV